MALAAAEREGIEAGRIVVEPVVHDEDLARVSGECRPSADCRFTPRGHCL
jgi:hypothetical protein